MTICHPSVLIVGKWRQKLKLKMDVIELKGRGHNRLMSKCGPFFYFWSDLPNFWYLSYRLIGKHYFIFFFTGFLFFLRNNV